MKRYLFTIRPTLKGPYVDTWFEVDGDDKATKNALFGMTVRARVNMAEGPLLIKSEDDWTPEAMEQYLRLLSPQKLEEFIDEADIKNSPSP